MVSHRVPGDIKYTGIAFQEHKVILYKSLSISMHFKKWVCISILILFFSTATASASDGYSVGTSPISNIDTSTDGYTIGTSPLPGNLTYNSGAVGNLSFWQLPLWIQIACLSSALIGLLALLKISPVVIGKIIDVLGNRNREKVFRHIQTHPGSTARDISREEGMNIGTVKYHVSMLQTASKITTNRIKKYVRIFQNSNTYDDKEKVILSALAIPAYKLILLSLMDSPGMTNRQIAKILEISESGSYQHMKSLLGDKIVRLENLGGIKKYYVNDDAKVIIEKSRR
jgi:predicted transcriptional regulator